MIVVLTEEGQKYFTKVILDYVARDPEAAQLLADALGFDLRAWLLEQAGSILPQEGPYR